MKIGVDLINSYLENPLKTETMVEVMERTEVEVEEILYASKLDSKIIVARILKVAKHPNADKLQLVEVETGVGVVGVVCGAPNVRVGLTVALAQIGAILPDGLQIEEAKIRGESSHGMLCSEHELGWGDDHGGIVELDPSFSPGQSLCDISKLGDVLDIKTPSNRWDYLSYIGLAREIVAFLPGNRLIEPESRKIVCQNREVVKVKNRDKCKLFISAKMRIKANTKSPRWLVDNLQSAGMRSINPVVDITNFVMLETGQPSHAYDAGKVQGSLGVRLASHDESLTALDGKKIILTEEDLVIVDNSGPIGLAGVMGGQKTEIETNTIEVIVEIANFDKTTVRRSALRHGMRTEASGRFERGLPLPLPQIAMERIVGLMQEICDGELIDSPVLQQYEDYGQKYLGMRVRKAERFLGYKLDEKEIVKVLNRRGFEPTHFSFSKEIKKYLGRPYMYGAQITTEKLEKFDCSLLTQHIYSRAGVSLGRTAQMQFDSGMEVPDFALKPGDLLFLHGDERQTKKTIGHVGMLTGNGKVLQASSTRKEVVLSPITKFTKAKNYAGARRYVDNFNHIVSVEVPWWRDDVTMDVNLFEDVAKALGYNRMPETLPQLPPTDTAKHQLLPSLMLLRNQLTALGLNEVMTYSFVSRSDIEKTHGKIRDNLQIENPLNSEQDFLRTNMLASHLQALQSNQANEAIIFEISRVYRKSEIGTDEDWRLAISICGEHSLLRLKGVIDKILGWYRVDMSLGLLKNDNFFMNRSASIDKYGYYGQLATVVDNFNIREEVSFAELNIENIITDQKTLEVRPVPPYQLVVRDITVEIEDGIWWQQVAESVAQYASRVIYKNEFTNPRLLKENKRRINFTVEFDMGANPQTIAIKQQLDKCHEALRKIPQTQVL